jgi:hypothetical protein
VWLFFEEAIPAALARRLGSHLLTEAMEDRPDIGLGSYDRLFPNQDTMPQGGFGNLIALPLQRAPRDQGDSVFVDDDLMHGPTNGRSWRACGESLVPRSNRSFTKQNDVAESWAYACRRRRTATTSPGRRHLRGVRNRRPQTWTAACPLTCNAPITAGATPRRLAARREQGAQRLRRGDSASLTP